MYPRKINVASKGSSRGPQMLKEAFDSEARPIPTSDTSHKGKKFEICRSFRYS